jgi:ABC-type antimicrobial peptide transport system permease subunit
MNAVGRQLRSALADTRLSLRARRRRAVLTAVGVALAAAMLSAAIVIADGLGDGFNRAVSSAHLGDLIVRFEPEREQQAARRIAALPDLSGFALRSEFKNASIVYHGHRIDHAVAEVIGSGRRQGYALVAGHNLKGTARDVLVEAALATALHVHVGNEVNLPGLGPERVTGIAEGPDDVGYPLAAARFYLTRAQIASRFRVGPDPDVNFAEIWLRDPRYLDEVLVQARDESFGLKDLQFVTRGGVRVLINQAAGIVIDLLVALSAIALATAAVMLAASARAEVQRRIRTIGIQRAVGATRGHVALRQALEATSVAAPAAVFGTLVAWAATYGPGNTLLALLNEPGPGASLIVPLLAGCLASVAIPVAGAAWPAWSAAGREVVSLLRGADVARPNRFRRRRRERPAIRSHRPRSSRRGGDLTRLGARMVAARPTRLAATVTMLAGSTAFVLLMIALAGALSSLETDPQALGKHYQLTALAPPSQAARISRVPGVAAAAPRYELHAVDAYSLGEIVDVIAYPRDHTRFEAPPLASGRRLHGNGEAEVGVGLADALGLVPGSDLLLELPSGNQLRLRVSGTVSSLDDEGLVAYVPAAALLAGDAAAPSQIAVVLKPGASQTAVDAALRRIGARPEIALAATARGAPLVAVLKTILRAVAIVDGLVCIYALIQACALTMQERRRTVAVLRACGAGPGAVRRLLFGAVCALVAPAALIGVLLERFVFGPVLAQLAASYATLNLEPSAAEILATVLGLAVAAATAVVWVTRAAVRESVVTGLSG